MPSPLVREKRCEVERGKPLGAFFRRILPSGSGSGVFVSVYEYVYPSLSLFSRLGVDLDANLTDDLLIESSRRCPSGDDDIGSNARGRSIATASCGSWTLASRMENALRREERETTRSFFGLGGVLCLSACA
jgi:hypothetical protein